jgi:hypothetical protein
LTRFLLKVSDVLALYGIKNNAKFTSEQIDMLLQYFDKNPYPTHEDKSHLSQILKLSEVQIANWFHHRRKKVKRDKK